MINVYGYECSPAAKSLQAALKFYRQTVYYTLYELLFVAFVIFMAEMMKLADKGLGSQSRNCSNY